MDFVELAWIPLVLGPKLLTGKMEQHGMLFHAMTLAAKTCVLVRARLEAEPFQSGIAKSS